MSENNLKVKHIKIGDATYDLAGGDGTVKSVNEVFPDEDGNVQLKISGVYDSGEESLDLTIVGDTNEPPYLCFTATIPNCNLELWNMGDAPSINLEYSTDGLNGWSPFIPDVTSLTADKAGTKFYLRASGSGNSTISAGYLDYYQFGHAEGGNSQWDVSGNIMSLLDPTCKLKTIEQEFCFFSLFKNTSIYTMPELPALTLAAHCYEEMFDACGLLSSDVVLPAETLADECYVNMFRSTPIKNIEIRALSLLSKCNGNMLVASRQLETVTVHFTEWPSNNNSNWMNGVKSGGTFYCPQSLIDATGSVKTNNTVPESWTMTAIS